MTTFKEKFGTDTDLESGAGVVLDYGDAGRITIHRAGGSNKKYERVMRALGKPYERQISMGTMDEDVARAILIEAYSTAVIIGWEGVENGKGTDLPFTKANCINLLTEVPELFADIQAQADRVAVFRHAKVEEVAKNSERGSASTSAAAKKRN